jgi:hypothetical protein
MFQKYWWSANQMATSEKKEKEKNLWKHWLINNRRMNKYPQLIYILSPLSFLLCQPVVGSVGLFAWQIRL